MKPDIGGEKTNWPDSTIPSEDISGGPPSNGGNGGGDPNDGRGGRQAKDGGRNEEVVVCSHFVHGAALGARPSPPGSCGREQATGSVLLVDLWGRGGGP